MSSLKCSFCEKLQNDVQKLIAGPGVYICSECVKECDTILVAENGKPRESTNVHARCSFCGKYESEVDRLVNGSTVRICNECVDLCGEILTEEGIEPWASSNVPKADSSKPSRESVLESIVDYVCSVENWSEIFHHAMEQNGISKEEVEAEIKKRSESSVSKKHPMDLFLTMSILAKTEIFGVDVRGD